MTKRETLAEQAEALAKATAELVQHCETARAAIDAAEARRADDHKKSMVALDAIFDLIDNFGKPKEATPEDTAADRALARAREIGFKPKPDRPTGIGFVEGEGIREIKP